MDDPHGKGTSTAEYPGGHGHSETRARGRPETQPIVSVVMPNLNKDPFIREAVVSVLSQSHENLELLVVDNGSKDGSVPFLEEIQKQDDRVRLLKEPQRGVSFALNKGIANARGAYVALMGSDDICRRDRLQQQVARLQKLPSSISYTEAWILNESTAATGQLYNRDRVKPLFANTDGLIFWELLRHDFVVGGSLMASREIIAEEPFDTTLDFGEDWDFLTRLSRRYAFDYIPEPLYGYRIYSGNTWASGNEKRVLENRVRIFEKWLKDFDDLEPIERRRLLKRLLKAQEDLEGRSGIVKTVLTHPSSSILLTKRAMSSLTTRMKRLAS